MISADNVNRMHLSGICTYIIMHVILYIIASGLWPGCTCTFNWPYTWLRLLQYELQAESRLLNIQEIKCTLIHIRIAWTAITLP